MVSQADFDDLKLIFYIVCGVFAAAILILIGCVIGLFAWIYRISLSLKKNQENMSIPFKPIPIGRTLNPNEELAKRYTMAGEDNNSFRKSPTLERNPLSRPTSLKRFDVSSGSSQTRKNENFHNTPGITKPPQKREKKQGNSSLDGMHFVEDKLRDDLYY